jgi:RHS repeat-associated protein
VSNKSGISSQVLSLPSGGGALKGIGETFSPDLFTGTGNLTVPLDLPPGRNGFQPQLHLGYSTGTGNGPFGVGWQLSVPGVSRKTAKGVPRYRDRAADPGQRDTFVLSGAEDLVQVSEAGAPERFRPRTEGLFARIERDRSPGNDVWRVRGRDGLVSLYGTPGSVGQDPAALADPANRARVFEWRLSETTDPFGNRIEYEYLHDASQDPRRRWGQLYLRRVRYIDFDREGDGQTRFLVSVSFVYEERPDPFSDCRAGFEIRTRLRCRRIEVRTHADHDLLVRTYELAYLDGLEGPDEPPNGVSLLGQIQVIGHDGDARQALPPLEFGYSRFDRNRGSIRPLAAVGASMPTESLASADLELVSLFGNGLPDLVQMNGATQFWRNVGGGRFAAPEAMPEVPALVRLADPGVHVADLNGNGRADLLAQGLGGYFPLGFQGRWSAQGFVRYDHLPSVALDAPDVRLVDLDGDGVVDALRTGAQEGFELFFNHPTAGWERVESRPPLEEFPDLSLADPRVKLGDLNGDGLQDLVLVQPGQIDYWPYLGHGQWGPRVSMDPGPTGLPPPGEDFDPKRVLLGDVDGDGLDDLVYVEPRRVTIWVNQSGNGWSDPIRLEDTPLVGDLDGVRVADMLGGGTAGILWSTQMPEPGANAYQFLDLTGGVKPYLLDRVDNHMGAVTRIRCIPSTRFYLADAEHEATRWRTPLPFPVQVVERVEVVDKISRGKLTTEYRYHHGYWDGAEREFRGFGVVGQLDSQTAEHFNTAARTDLTADFDAVEDGFSPPTLTRTWFHLGPVGDERARRSEVDPSADFWPIDPQQLPRPPDTAALLEALPDRHRSEALRSLRGSILRTELYALDGSPLQDRPYTVREMSYALREEEPPETGEPDRRRIFFPHLVAQRTTRWERGDDPLTLLSFVEDHDAFGQPRRQMEVACPRGWRSLAESRSREYLASITVTSYARPPDDRYLVDRIARQTTFELADGTGTGQPERTVGELLQGARDGVATHRVAEVINHYDGPAFVGLPEGAVGSAGALTRSEVLVVTDDRLRDAYGALPPYLEASADPPWTDDYPLTFRALAAPHAGYRLEDGAFYAIAAQHRYDTSDGGSGRGLLLATRNVVGGETSIEYDAFELLPSRITDPAELTTAASYDSRLLRPSEVTDVNRNVTRFVYTPLGLLRESWMLAAPDRGDGDRAEPSMRYEYDLMAFVDRGEPVSVRTIRRVFHDTNSAVPADVRDETVETLEFSDGLGRLVQTRTRSENVRFGVANGGVLPADQEDEDGTAADVTASQVAGGESAVVVSGTVRYDNKGRVLERFEPSFGTGWSFTSPDTARVGASTRLEYDPCGRLVRTTNPDGSVQQVVLGVPARIDEPDDVTPTPWEMFTYDANDNAGRTHPAQARNYRHHWNTPTSAVFDALGRAVQVVERNGPDPQTDWHITRTAYDLLGNVLKVVDSRGVTAFRLRYDLAGHMLRVDSLDAGTQLVVFDAGGAEVERRDAKGALVLRSYDAAGRLLLVWGRDREGEPMTLRQRLVYGAGAPSAANLRGRLVRQYDEAGLAVIEAYDRRGSPLERIRRMIADERILPPGVDGARVAPLDWEPLPGTTLETLEQDLLDPVQHRVSSSYDALGRIQSIRYPETVLGRRPLARLRYGGAGLLEGVDLDEESYVESIAYNARRQRLFVAYGNGTLTRLAYDPHTFRPLRLRTEHVQQTHGSVLRPRGPVIQDTAFSYDLAGNLLTLSDRSPGVGLSDRPDHLDRTFGYDPLYRLQSASGRECPGTVGPAPWEPALRCTDASETRAYEDRFGYDVLGRLRRVHHDGADGTIVRTYDLDGNTNRVTVMTTGQVRIEHAYDASGNLTRETAGRHFSWDCFGCLRSHHATTPDGATTLEARYLHDAVGQRLKKVVRSGADRLESTTYVHDLFERRVVVAGDVTETSDTLHVADDRQTIALVHAGPPRSQDAGPTVQYLLRDQVGSTQAVVGGERASDSTDVRREEYTPFGETSFGAVSTPYRFGGAERDEESGFAHIGARSYAPWLARWTSPDPLGFADGLDVYCYARNNPLSVTDRSGLQAQPDEGPFPLSQASADEYGPYWRLPSGGSVRLWNWSSYQYYAPGATSPSAEQKLEGGEWVAWTPGTVIEIGPGTKSDSGESFIGWLGGKAGEGLAWAFTGMVEGVFGGSVANAPEPGQRTYPRQSYTEQAIGLAAGLGIGKLVGKFAPKAVRTLSNWLGRGASRSGDDILLPGVEEALDEAFAQNRVRSGRMIQFSDAGGPLTDQPPPGQGFWFHEKIVVQGAGPGGRAVEIRTHSPHAAAPAGSYSREGYTTIISTMHNNPRYLVPLKDGSWIWKTWKQMTNAERNAMHIPSSGQGQ